MPYRAAFPIALLVAGLLAACQAPVPTAEPAPAAPAAPAAEAPAAPAPVAAPPAAPALADVPAATRAPAEPTPSAGPREDGTPKVSKEAAIAKAKEAGVENPTLVVLLQAESHARAHRVATERRVWVVRDAALRSACFDATTGARLEK